MLKFILPAVNPGSRPAQFFAQVDGRFKQARAGYGRIETELVTRGTALEAMVEIRLQIDRKHSAGFGARTMNRAWST